MGEIESGRPCIGITGGSGYIGSNIAAALSSDYQVRILDPVAPGKELGPSVSYLNCDICRPETLKDALTDLDFVVHSAIIQIPKIVREKELAYRVNVLGTQNVCRAISESPKTKGMILASSWHTVGERGLDGMINESFGYRPDKVEDRARLYTLSKIIQEGIVRFYDESVEGTYGILRMGTVLGEGMPAETAANIFIEKGLKGEPLTPFKHSMYRPIFFVDIEDVKAAYLAFVRGILNGQVEKTKDSFSHVINFFGPQPVTVLELAEIVSETILELTAGAISPKIEVIDKGLDSPFTSEDKYKVWGDLRRARRILELEPTTSVHESIQKIVRTRLPSVRVAEIRH